MRVTGYKEEPEGRIWGLTAARTPKDKQGVRGVEELGESDV